MAATLAGGSTTLENNGDGTLSTTDADYRYGEFLGNEFKDLPNIVWLSGNDFQCVYTTADNNDVMSVVNGIRATDPGALQTMEADFENAFGAGCAFDQCLGSTSLTTTDSTGTGWDSQVQIDFAYTYAPMYAKVRAAYAEQSTMPTVLGESNYEGQQDDPAHTDGCITIRFCRLAEWWTMTSGATGQLYGGPCYGITNGTDLSTCDTTGVDQLKAQTDFLKTIDWWKLVPDTSNSVVTSGTGSCPTTGSSAPVTCVTTASDYDGSAGSATESISYLPDPSGFSDITVDMADFAGPVNAEWIDPTNGSSETISGSPFTNSGSESFQPTHNNSAGDNDWVLLLQS